MKRMAMIKNGTVENIALWDGISLWEPSGYELVDVTGNADCCIGCLYIDGIFYALESQEFQAFMAEESSSNGLVVSSFMGEQISLWQRFKDWLTGLFA